MFPPAGAERPGAEYVYQPPSPRGGGLLSSVGSGALEAGSLRQGLGSVRVFYLPPLIKSARTAGPIPAPASRSACIVTDSKRVS